MTDFTEKDLSDEGKGSLNMFRKIQNIATPDTHDPAVIDAMNCLSASLVFNNASRVDEAEIIKYVQETLEGWGEPLPDQALILSAFPVIDQDASASPQ